MAQKYCGSDFVLSAGNDDGPPETFTPIGSTRDGTLTLNDEFVDVTDKDDDKWKKGLDNCGVKAATFSASGIYSDAAGLQQLQEDFAAGISRNYLVTSGRLDTWEGRFLLTSFERTGTYNDSEQCSFTLESSAALVYTPAP